MLKKLYLSFILLTFASLSFAQQIQSPSEFLGYKLGTQFTPHSRIVEYFRYVAEVSKNVKLTQYGSTNEGRPLLAMFIASDENIARLDEIRQHNLSLAGQTDTNPTVKNAPVIVWLVLIMCTVMSPVRARPLCRRCLIYSTRLIHGLNPG